MHCAARLSRAFRTAPPARGWLSLAPASATPWGRPQVPLLFTSPFSAQSVRTIASIAPAASAPAEVAGKDAAQRCWAVAVGVAAGFAWAAHDVLTTAASDKQGTAALADKQGGRGNAVVTEDDAYMKGIKLYGIGIKDDPVPGEKRGKGMQRMNSSYWMLALAVFIQHNFAEIQAMVQFAHDHTAKETLDGTGVGFDFRYFINCSNALFIKAENEGLKTKDSIDYFLMAAWLAMAAAEVDGYRYNSYAKYSTAERAQMRAAFYAQYLEKEGMWDKDDGEDNPEMEDQLGKYAIDSCRIDLIPSVALERLGLHNELCSIKWTDDPTGWQRNGFQISPRIDSLKRHFESVHARDYSEDHISHLIWGFMAIYHVNLLYPELNDMPNLEALRSSKCGDLYYTEEMLAERVAP